ncbi:MAG: CHAT domain-containing protein, partial [Cyanobacteria bacterium J06576_12]
YRHLPDCSSLEPNLASAYKNRIRGDRAENIELAIAAYGQSLDVMTRSAMPIDWATSMNNLANAYADRIREDRAENIEAAIAAYSKALEIYTPEAHPNDCRRTARLLANLFAAENCWPKAHVSYSVALTAAETLYQAALSKSSQESELSETNDLYRRAAYAYAKVDNLTVAVATLEQGRARGLSEALQRDRTDLETIRAIAPDLVERYQTAANAINQLDSTERRIITDRKSPKYSQEEFRQQSIQSRQALNDCITEIRQIPGYENFLSLPTFDDIASTIQPEHPLVYILSTPTGSLALILTTEGVSDLWLNDLTEPQLRDILANDWFSAYRERQNNRQGWLKAIADVTHQLWNKMMAPLVNHLQLNNLSKAILIPTGYLSYLPLHAAWTPDTTKPSGRRYACDDIQFTYTPNALSLDAARTVANQTSAITLLAINEPKPINADDLPSSSAEAAKAISVFGKGNWKLLQQENATRTAVLEQLPQKNVVHFS